MNIVGALWRFPGLPLLVTVNCPVTPRWLTTFEMVNGLRGGKVTWSVSALPEDQKGNKS